MDEVELEVAPAQVMDGQECAFWNLVMQGGHIGRTLDQKNQDGQISGHLIHLPPSALSFHLEFPEIRNENSEKLDDDGCRDIRHHTEGENRSIAEGSSGEHVQEAYEAFLGIVLKIRQLGGINARQNDERAQTINQQQKNRIYDSLAQFFNFEDVSYSLYKLLHYFPIVVAVPP